MPIDQQVTDEHDKMIDATIEKMDDAGVFDGFKLVNPAPPPKPIHVKPLDICGVSVEIERSTLDEYVTYRTKVQRKAIIDVSLETLNECVRPPFCESASFWGKPTNERDVHDRAMAWADKTAHAIAVMNAAASALSREPDIVIEDSDIEGGEYWQKVCELADQGGEPPEGVYVADITAIMDSPEVSADMGGKYNVCEPPHIDYWVRCELLLTLNPCYTGGRWLAVYQLEVV